VDGSSKVELNFRSEIERKKKKIQRAVQPENASEDTACTAGLENVKI
jgi:hypothetical protein